MNGRSVLVGDGIKVAKSGRKMPGVKKLHQQSESNTKPEYIFGHSCQAIAVLTQALSSVFAIPLACRIHEGVVFSNLNLSPLEIIRICGLRFKIEVSFKQALRVVGAYAYHFWMGAM